MATPARPRRRADAERSIARIVSAAREVLGRDPGASIDEIVTAAGVGRMTLYGHFPNRAALVEAALADAIREGEEALSAVELGGDARAAMTRLLAATWSLVAESARLLEAAEELLPAARIRELHGKSAARVEDLIHRGQRQGVFRTDLPTDWLVNVVHYILNGAAEESRAGRLRPGDAPAVVIATIESVLAPPR
ncbi:TetR/AcrR family transcriptional regulator [Amycolatopsis viridis]|uniref:AcrR family transcriptional regulator n=1 Tax=Amycolatopsis viridis TaxID=185678 RepID=A0ABX0T1A1_9PSEU|nr:TetR/AcrR family transcriptional regulator [Amycolatopsis viridis]NIH81320.1 AcrR family transcriptional regulator [Amycolatopsis viridis]